MTQGHQRNARPPRRPGRPCRRPAAASSRPSSRLALVCKYFWEALTRYWSLLNHFHTPCSPTPLSSNPLAYLHKLEGTTKLTTWNVNGLQSAGSKDKGVRRLICSRRARDDGHAPRTSRPELIRTSLLQYAFRKYVEAEDADVLILTEVKYPGASKAVELDWLKRRYQVPFLRATPGPRSSSPDTRPF